MTNKTIWKFTLPANDRPTIFMPVGSIVLHAAWQGGDLCIWAVVDPTAERERRYFRVYGTGDVCESDPGDYIGTLFETQYVWHLFQDDPHRTVSPSPLPRTGRSSREPLDCDRPLVTGTGRDLPAGRLSVLGGNGGWSPTPRQDGF